mgnify:CR=1 FL=1
MGQGFTQWNPWYKMPRVHQFSAAFQFLAARNSVIDVSYVGNRTTAYSGNVNMNLPSWDFARQCDMLSGGKLSFCNALVPNPFAGLVPGTAINSATVARSQLLRPYPQFSGFAIQQLPHGSLWYNALQVSLIKRYSHGLFFTAAYTLSKNIEKSHAAKAQVLLVGMMIPPNYGPRYGEDFRKMFSDLAGKYSLAFVPFLLDQIALNPELMQADGIHPNSAGQPQILKNLWPQLKPLLVAPGKPAS